MASPAPRGPGCGLGPVGAFRRVLISSFQRRLVNYQLQGTPPAHRSEGRMNTRITAALLSTLAIFLCLTAHAQTTEPETATLLPTAHGTVVDQFPFDGVANDLDRAFVVVELTNFEPVSETLGDRRGVTEFDLSSLAGRSIRRATIELIPSFIPVP